MAKLPSAKGCWTQSYYDIWYDIFNCNWVATRWQ